MGILYDHRGAPLPKQKTATPRGPEAMLPTDIVGNEIDGLKSRLEGEQDLKKREELESALQELEALRQPVASDNDLTERIDQVYDINEYIDALETGFPVGDRVMVGHFRAAFHENVQGLLGGNVILNERDELPEDYERERLRFIEVRNIQINHIQEWLRKKRNAIAEWAEGEGKKWLGPDEQTEFSRRVGLLTDKMESSFSDPEKKNDDKTYKELHHDLEAVTANIEEKTLELKGVEAKKEEITAEGKKELAEVQRQLNDFTPERIEFLRQRGRRSPRREEALNDLLNPGGELRSQLKEAEAILNEPDKNSLTDLQEALIDLQYIKKRLEAINVARQIDLRKEDPEGEKKMERYAKIRAIVDQLKDKDALAETVLKDPFFEGHIERLSDKKFDKLYGKHTDGGMVFYQKGDVWKIIIRETPGNFKQELVHELRHLEFDAMPKAMRQGYLQLIKEHAEWPRVRDKFVAQIGANKKPHTAGEDAQPPYAWPDDEIIDELYAMQDALGNSQYEDLLRSFAAIGGVGTFEPGDKRSAEEIIRDARRKQLEEEEETERTKGAVADPGGHHDGGEESGEEHIDLGIASPGECQETIDRNRTLLKEIQGSPYLGLVPGLSGLAKVMEEYNEETHQINKEYFVNPTNKFLAKEVIERKDKVKDAINEAMHHLDEAGGHTKEGGGNPFRRLWMNTTFLSIDDIIQAGVDVKEYIERRYKRKKADKAAKLGAALFAGTTIGQEAKAREKKAEGEEVQEWQGRYEHNIDAWELEKIMHTMAKSPVPNKDQMKAILRVLADKGRINWYNPDLWVILSKLQNKVKLDPNNTTLKHSRTLLRTKLHQAIGEIWDYDEFGHLETKNESAYKNMKSEFEESYNKIQKELTSRMGELLAEHRAGEKVEPPEYEEAIEYAIVKGKSSAEASLFYLIAGMADGLLNEDRGMLLDKYLNEWPATQWIYSKNPPLNKEEYIKICKTYFPESYEAGKPMGDFMNFYWTQVQNDPMTVQRVRKSVSQRKWDHDWTRTIACMGDSNTAKRFLSGRSGQQEAMDTGIENMMVGTLQWAEENARDPKKTNWRENFTRHLAFFAMTDGILEEVAYRDTQIYSRINDSINNASARESDSTNHANWKVKQHWDRMRKFAGMIDPAFFKLIRNRSRANNDRAGLAKDICDYLDQTYGGLASHNKFLDATDKDGTKSLNTIFNNMDKIIGVIMTNKSDGELLNVLNKFNHGTPPGKTLHGHDGGHH